MVCVRSLLIMIVLMHSMITLDAMTPITDIRIYLPDIDSFMLSYFSLIITNRHPLILKTQVDVYHIIYEAFLSILLINREHVF